MLVELFHVCSKLLSAQRNLQSLEHGLRGRSASDGIHGVERGSLSGTMRWDRGMYWILVFHASDKTSRAQGWSMLLVKFLVFAEGSYWRFDPRWCGGARGLSADFNAGIRSICSNKQVTI
jgi:hypothetical protein